MGGGTEHIYIEYLVIQDSGAAWYARGHHPPEQFINTLIPLLKEAGEEPKEIAKLSPERIKHQLIRYCFAPANMAMCGDRVWMQTDKPGKGAMKITIYYPGGLYRQLHGELGFHGDSK